jgi:hypothetical protein
MSEQPAGKTPEYLIIGHVTRDLIDEGFSLGGTAVYCALLAQRLGIQTAIFTACDDRLDLEILEGVRIHNQGSVGTTTFKNQYSSSGRTQRLHHRASELDISLLPPGWNKARIVHLAPVIGEVSLDAGKYFQESSVFYSLQGWLRKWDKEGIVSPAPFPDPDQDCFHPQGAFLSIEDVGFERSQLDLLIHCFPLLIFTLGQDGAEIYQKGVMTPIPATPAVEIDPTGAGDIFAAAFIIEKVMKGKSVAESARTAAQLAALSVTRPGLEGVPSIKEIQELHKVH